MAKKSNPSEEFEVNIDTLKPYVKGTKKHRNYVSALDEYYHMSFHFDGYFIPTNSSDGLLPKIGTTNDDPINGNPYFERLIDTRRPSESSSIKAYRRSIYLPESKSPCFKVYNSLRKIVKASDWKIDYDKKKPSGIADGEYLEDYCEKNYPAFTSVENWFYTYGMKQMLVDSNALVYVLPESFEIDDTGYYKPVANVINCKDVFDYKKNEYAIFIVDRHCEYPAGKSVKIGTKFGVITKEGYWEIVPDNTQVGFHIEGVGVFQMDELPAWIIGGIVKKYNPERTLYNSFMAPMLPGLDGMAMAISDEDAEWVQHVYSTMWYFSQQDCKHCMGKGWMNGRGKQNITCSECNGTGGAPKSPYRDMVLKTGSFDSDKMPTPPAGYVQKQTDIAKLFVERVDKKEWRALAAVNHEFLAEAPVVQSGVAKSYDRQELENYTYSVAYHAVENVLKPVYYFINEFRYKELISSEEVRNSMLPKIPVPQKYDLVNAAVIESQMKAASEAKADPEIMDQLEMEYISKQFPNDPELRDKMRLKKMLDPFPRLTVDEKNNLLLSNSVERIDVVVSNYLHPFIEQALDEDEGFCDKDYADQVKKIYEYGQKKADSLDAAQKIKDKAKAAAAAKAGGLPNDGN